MNQKTKYVTTMTSLNKLICNLQAKWDQRLECAISLCLSIIKFIADFEMEQEAPTSIWKDFFIGVVAPMFEKCWIVDQSIDRK